MHLAKTQHRDEKGAGQTAVDEVVGSGHGLVGRRAIPEPVSIGAGVRLRY